MVIPIMLLYSLTCVIKVVDVDRFHMGHGCCADEATISIVKSYQVQANDNSRGRSRLIIDHRLKPVIVREGER